MSAPPRPAQTRPALRERRRLVAFVDCTAFYCSCEQLFRPELRGRPVVVLSNNDGCVIARTPEAKALGVPMGAPYFKVRDRLAADGVAVFSSNYALYHDVSDRVAAVLGRFAPDVDRYSIDEAFLELTADPWAPFEHERLGALAREIRRAVWDAVRVPVRVGIAETKTLAKAAAEWARAMPEAAVCLWRHPDRARALELPVEDVWGVGPRWARRLRADGAETAAGLAALDDRHLRQRYNVVLLRTALELRGVSCLPLGQAPPPRRSLVRSRMFGTPQSDPAAIAKAVSMHAAAAGRVLRDEGKAASALEVFVTTGRHADAPHHGRALATLPHATNDTLALVRAARRALPSCLRPGVRYKKAGVMLSGLGPAGAAQADLFRPGVRGHPALMAAMDDVARRFGRGAVVVAAQGTPRELRDIHAGRAGSGWGMAREHLSPRYTTAWAEIPRASVGPWTGPARPVASRSEDEPRR